MIMLQIIGCSNDSYWYAGRAGSVFPFLGQDAGEFITREPSGMVNIIKCADAQLVDVTPTQTFSSVAHSVDTYKVALDVFLLLPPDADVSVINETVRRLAKEVLSVKFGPSNVGVT